MGHPLYILLYAAGILFFCYFYTSIVFNPTDTADNMRKYGGFIPGIRPGKKTADYIDTVLSRITIVGALYLTFVALLPDFLNNGFKVQGDPGHRPVARRGPAAVPDPGLRLQLLLRRHVAADRRRRRHGHRPAGRVQARRAPLHRLPEEEPYPGTPQLADARSSSSALRAAARAPRRSSSRSGWGSRPSRRATSCARRSRRARRWACRRRPSWRRASSSPTTLIVGLDPRPDRAAGRARRLHPRRLPADGRAGRGARDAAGRKVGRALGGCQLRGPRGGRSSSGCSGARRGGGPRRRPAGDDPERLRVYREKTEPLVGFYRERGLLADVDGVGAVAEIAARDRQRPDVGARRARRAGVITIRSQEELLKLEEASRDRPRDARRRREGRGAGRHDRRARPDRRGRDPAPRRAARVRRLPRLPEDALHVDQRRGRPRHPGQADAPGGRRRRDRLRRDRRAATTATRRGRSRSARSRRAREAPRGHAQGPAAGIAAARPGGRVSDIGAAVEAVALAHGYGVVRDFVGHGVGTALHEEPQIPNYGPAGRGSMLQAGMVLAIEPMFNLGRAEVSRRRGRLDRADAGQVGVGALRAHGRARAAGGRDPGHGQPVAPCGRRP